jgi:hypothetical protein
MRLLRFAGLVAALLGMSEYATAATTTLLQTGTWTQGQAPMYAAGGGSQPIVQASGPAGGGALGLGMTEGLYVMTGTGAPPFAGTGTGPSGTNWCDYDGPLTSPYHFLCISPNAQGGSIILSGFGGAASAVPLTVQSAGNMVVRSGGTLSITSAGTFTITAGGATRTFPWMLGPNSSSVGDLALWGDTTGTTLTSATMSGDCTLATNGAITCTKTGGVTLGTMAVQNASGVAITGGTITGMPSPLSASDVATKGYADAIATGLRILPSSTLATTGALPNTPTYSNGASGVGATLTAGSNTTLTVDSTSAVLNTIVLVKNQAAPAQNGIYKVTTAGDGSNPWVLTRATYFDQAAEMLFQSYTFVTGGATLDNTSYSLAAAVATVGTDPVNWNLFSSGVSGIGYGGTSTGSANAQVIAPTNFGAADGQQISFTAGFSNTGAMTLDAGTGALAVKVATATGPAALVAGQVIVNNRVVVIYQGGSYYLVNPAPLPPTVLSIALGGTGQSTASAAALALAPSGAASFSAYNTAVTGDQPISCNTWTKLNLQSTVFNIGGLYDTVNSKWTPPAGRVVLSAGVQLHAGGVTVAPAIGYISIYKDGGGFRENQIDFVGPTQVDHVTVAMSIVDQASGTDYYQAYVYSYGCLPAYNKSPFETYFMGSML